MKTILLAIIPLIFFASSALTNDATHANCGRPEPSYSSDPPNSNHSISMAAATTPIPALSEKNKRNFFGKVSTIPTSSGCLEWTAYKNPQGYGRCKTGLGGQMLYAHRLAYFLATGTDPGEMLVCHTCDNPSCVNPAHLFLGTYSDNLRDMLTKGRENPVRGNNHHARLRPERMARGDSHGSRLHPERCPRGESNGSAKLTAADIPNIRSDKRTQKTIAAEYGISRTQISNIKLRVTWAHVA